MLQKELDAEYHKALRWMRVIYCSELSFLLHLPLFVAPNSFQTAIYVLRALCNISAAALYVRFGIVLPAAILLGISGVLYYVSYEHQKEHLATLLFNHAKTPQTDPPHYISIIPAKLYWITHTLSPLNYLFDLPAIGIPTVLLTRVIVCATNLVCILYYLYYLFCEEPLNEAWGCYATYDGKAALNYGMCPAAYNRPAASCCDQPGVDCSKTNLHGATDLHSLLLFVHLVEGVTFGIYSISALTKLAYLRAEEQRVCTLIARISKQS